MKYRKLSDTGPEVSSVCLGTWVFGGDFWGGAKDSDSSPAVEEAVEKGVNFIDTAPVYGWGRSEEVIGRALRGKRDKVFIATKCGLRKKGRTIGPDLKGAFIREEIENSLRRLQTERIDLYQCHWPDPETPLEETFGEMKRLQDEGKIKYIGVCNFDKPLLEKALEFAPIASDQVQYSLLKRDIEKDLMPFCKERKVSILTYGSLGGGILTGKYKEPRTFGKGDARTMFYDFYREPFWSISKKLVAVLEEISSKRGCPTSEVAINWALSHPEVTSCIAGCRNAAQLRQNAAAADWKLSGDELAMIEGEYKKAFSDLS